MKYSEDQVRERVVQALARCMARNASEITGAALLIQDLGLDSLDFMDLMFALEKVFQVKIRNDDFDRLMKPTQNGTLPPDLSDEEVRVMGRFIPGLEQKAMEQKIPRNMVMSMMTVDTLVYMIAGKLKQQEGGVPCGG